MMRKILINTAITLLVLYQMLLTYISIGNNELRFDRFLLPIMILFNLYFLVRILCIINVNNTVKRLHLFIGFFISLYLISAVIYSFTHSLELVYGYLPTIMLVIPTISTFFYATYFGYISQKQIKIITIIFLCIAFYSFYSIYLHKVDLLGEDFYKHSNNSGYSFVLILPLLFLSFKNNKFIALILSSVFFVFVLFAAKRGAIIIYSIIYVYYLIYYISHVSVGEKITITGLLLIAFMPTYIILKEKMGYLLFRFTLDGASGRDEIYSSILEAFQNSTFWEFCFGHGFFSVFEVTSAIFGFGLMAHSDYLEIILDLGLLGIMIYLSIIYFLIRYIVKIPMEFLYEKNILIMCCVIWSIKALASGVFMVKDSVLLMCAVGVVMGYIERRKTLNANTNEKDSFINSTK